MLQKSFRNDGFEYEYSRKTAVAQREYDRQEAIRTKRLLEVPAAVSSRRLPKLSQSRGSSRSSTRSHSRCSSTTASPRPSGPSSPDREQHFPTRPPRSSSLRARGVGIDEFAHVKKSVNCIPNSPRMTLNPTQGAARAKVILPPLPSQHLPSNELRESGESLVRIGSPANPPFRDLAGQVADHDKSAQLKKLESAKAVKDWLAEANERIASVFPSSLINENLNTTAIDNEKTKCADTPEQVNETLAQEKGMGLASNPSSSPKEGGMEDGKIVLFDARDLRASATSYASDFEDESFLGTFTQNQEATARPEDLRILKRGLHPGDLDMEDVPFVSANAVQQSQYEDDFEDDFGEE